MQPMTVNRSYDLHLLKQAGGMLERNDGFDWAHWLDDENNIMLIENDDVGLATFEYFGLYTVHWFYESRGRDAIGVAKRMIKWMFDNTGCQVIRGLTPIDIKPARWLAKHVGLKSYGTVSFADETCELMMTTKDTFNG
jgi:hypothetical protein